MRIFYLFILFFKDVLRVKAWHVSLNISAARLLVSSNREFEGNGQEGDPLLASFCSIPIR